MQLFRIPSLILALFGLRCPAAIFWAVVSIIINAINGKFGPRPCPAFGSWPHVLVKRLERVKPPLTNIYSSAAIVLIVFVSASLPKSAPSPVLDSASHAMPVIVANNYFPVQASAAFGQSAAKVGEIDDSDISTVAKAAKFATITVVDNLFFDSPPSVSCSRSNFNLFWHKTSLI